MSSPLKSFLSTPLYRYTTIVSMTTCGVYYYAVSFFVTDIIVFTPNVGLRCARRVRYVFTAAGA
jgi:hypothetical protein